MNHDSRLNQLLQLLNEEPKDPFLLYAIALEYEKMENYQTAIQYYSTLINQQPEYTATYLQLGNLYRNLGDIENATRIYQDGIKHTIHTNHKAYFELKEALEQIE